MTHEQPQPPNRKLPAASVNLDSVEGSFIRDETAVQQALSYLDEVEQKWVLDPTAVDVVQPDNQGQLIKNLESMLNQGEGDQRWTAILRSDIDHIRTKSEYDKSGFTKLAIRKGYNIGAVDTSGLTRQQYQASLRDASYHEEYINDPDEPNVLISGLLLATGAQLIRDDIADGNGSGSRVYKGMFESKPVYFVENIEPRVINEEGEKSTHLERSFFVEGEETVRTTLNRLSKNDEDILKSIGISIPIIGGREHGEETYPNRERMSSTIRGYAMFNQPGETKSTERGLGVEPGNELQQRLLDDQVKRDITYRLLIMNFRHNGYSEKQIDAFTAEIARMKQAEIGRGRLFSDLSTFIRYDSLVEPGSDLDMGVDSGFEQGDDLLLELNRDLIEGGWTFMGIDKQTGQAELARFDDETRERLHRNSDLKKLQRLNMSKRK